MAEDTIYAAEDVIRIPWNRVREDVLLCCHRDNYNRAWLWFEEHKPRPGEAVDFDPEWWLLWREWERRRGEDRRYIPVAVRRAVLERDGCCQVCGATGNLTLDHVEHYSRGGLHTKRNLRVLCRSCNSRRGTKRDKEWRAR